MHYRNRPAIYGLVILSAVLAALASKTRGDEHHHRSTPPPPPPEAPVSVSPVIERAKAYLYKVQQNGLWEPSTNLSPEADGGLTALATYALLAAGENPQDPRLAKAVAYLKTLQSPNVYVQGMRAQIWSYLPENFQRQKLVNENAQLIISQMKTAPASRGMWYYPKTDPIAYDHSISQYGVLGLWALQQDGAEIDSRIWEIMDQKWRADEDPDGGWAYKLHTSGDEGTDTISMACAGAASLFITTGYVHAMEARNCDGNLHDENIEHALHYITSNFNHVIDGSPREKILTYYSLYGIERVADASGLKYFGNVNWFGAGTKFLTAAQSRDGSWGNEADIFTHNLRNIPDTCFGLLFLVHGNAPVVVNKLSYTSAMPKQKDPSAWWNQRPRDMFNLTHWLGAQTESIVNWNVVSLTTPDAELHDAPVLYIASSVPPAFSDDEKDKLRRYIQDGGMILANADCGARNFTEAFEKAMEELLAPCRFRELPADHPIFTNQQFPARKWGNKPKLRGLSNGVRELVVLIPQQDFARAWQIPFQGNITAYGAGADIIEYACDRVGITEPRAPYHVEPDPNIKPTRTIHLARLEYDGNWQPEPGGWRRMASILHNDDKAELVIDPVELGQGKLSPDMDKVASLTGTEDPKLTPIQWKELKSYAERGGTLLIDAAGGSSTFANAMEVAFPSAFGAAAAQFNQPASEDDPIYPPKLGEVGIYRSYAKRVLGNLRAPELRVMKIDKRNAVIFSRLDLSNGIVGADVDGIVGYKPAIATAIVHHIILEAAGK